MDAHLLLPGARLLRKFLEERDMTITAFAEAASRGEAKVDRVTVSNIVNGRATRVSVPVAKAIELGSGGEIPLESFDPHWSDPKDTFVATGTDSAR